MGKKTISRQFKIVMMAQDVIMTQGGKPAVNTIGALEFHAEVPVTDLGNELAVKKAMKGVWDKLTADPNFPKFWEKAKY